MYIINKLRPDGRIIKCHIKCTFYSIVKDNPFAIARGEPGSLPISFLRSRWLIYLFLYRIFFPESKARQYESGRTARVYGTAVLNLVAGPLWK